MSENEDRSGVDAAQAFEDLRAEVALQRRVVEALGDALESHQTPDLSPDIARILKGQLQVQEKLGVLEAHPALQLTPVQHAQAIAHAGRGLLREATQQLQQAVQDVERERSQLGRLVAGVKTKRQQRQTLLWVGGAAVVTGLFLSPVLGGMLPVSVSSRIAAFHMGEDRWKAGALIMGAASPEQWDRVVESDRLVRANEDAVAACRQAAAKTKRDQRCAIVIPSP